MGFLEIKFLSKRMEMRQTMANYIPIDNESIKVKNMLKEGGQVDQNTAFRRKWSNIEMQESGGQLIFLLSQSDGTKIKYIIDTDGTVIIDKNNYQ